MSRYDDQGDEALRKNLAALDLPPPDPDARRRAIALARQEFESAQQSESTKTETPRQGFFSRLRHIIAQQPDDGRANMLLNQRSARACSSASTMILPSASNVGEAIDLVVISEYLVLVYLMQYF